MNDLVAQLSVLLVKELGAIGALDAAEASVPPPEEATLYREAKEQHQNAAGQLDAMITLARRSPARAEALVREGLTRLRARARRLERVLLDYRARAARGPVHVCMRCLLDRVGERVAIVREGRACTSAARATTRCSTSCPARSPRRSASCPRTYVGPRSWRTR